MQHVAEMLQRALSLQQQGQLTEAEKIYTKVLKINSNHFDALHLLGLLQHQRGDGAKALGLIAAALKVNPNSAEALLNHGTVLSALDRHEDALVSYDRALALKPLFPSALNNRGNALSELGRHQEALASFDQALRVNSSDGKALTNRGKTLRDLNRHKEALACHNRVLKLKPDDTGALNNCGNELILLDRTEEALTCFDRALKLDPGDAETLHNRGSALLLANRYQEALACFAQALALKPDHAKCHCDFALAQLAAGDLTQGWKEYEWRLKTVNFLPNPRNFPQPRWNGEYINGTLLAWGEQGLGDEILYASMVPDLVEHAECVVLQVEPRLAKLFARSFPDVRVTGRGERVPENVKAQSPLASFGQYLRTSWESFPKRERGYLTPDAEMVARLRQRLSPKGEVVVGLSWVSKNPSIGNFKTARLGDLDLVLRLPGCRFIDLQYGDTLAEREALKQARGLVVERLQDVDNTNDIDALAALITACDLVVTVSNTTAHLAGALGKPTMVFVPFGQARLWYWLHDRDDSPWYPHVRVKRQKQGQSWADTVASAADEFSTFVKAAHAKQPA